MIDALDPLLTLILVGGFAVGVWQLLGPADSVEVEPVIQHSDGWDQLQEERFRLE